MCGNACPDLHVAIGHCGVSSLLLPLFIWVWGLNSGHQSCATYAFNCWDNSAILLTLLKMGLFSIWNSSLLLNLNGTKFWMLAFHLATLVNLLIVIILFIHSSNKILLSINYADFRFFSSLIQVPFVSWRITLSRPSNSIWKRRAKNPCFVALLLKRQLIVFSRTYILA